MSIVEKTPEEVLPVTLLNQKTGSQTPLHGSPQEEEMLRYANSCFEMAKHNRLQFERQWYLNLAFYAGKQYVTWTDTAQSLTAKLIVPPAPPWRVRLVDNQIRKYVRKEHAKSVKEPATGFVLPASGEDSDLMAAKAGDQILEHCLRESQFEQVKRSAVWWANMTGNGFIKDWYNKADRETDSPNDMPTCEMITPFHIYIPDVVTKDIEGQEYLFHAASRTIHFVRNNYGVEVAGSSSSRIPEDKYLQALGVSGQQEKDMVYVKEGWFKPGGKYKEGAVIVWMDGQVLFFHEGWPYDHGEYPFTKIDHIPTGKFYSESIVTDLIPLQKEYNRTRSQIIEAKNRMAKPQLRAPLGSIDANKITSEPGQIIFYKPGFDKPEPLDLQSLPSYVIQELERNKIDMDDISSQHEVSRGQAPPGVEAATAIAYLQEQDDSVLNELTYSIEAAYEKIGRHYLSNVNKNWDEPRKIQVVGLNQQLEAQEFSKANLKGNTDYKIQHGSATPRSYAAKQAWIMDAIKTGLIPPAMGLKHLDMAEVGRIYEEMQIDIRQAQRENLKMNQGQGIPEPQPIPPEMYEQMGIDPVQAAMQTMAGQPPSIPPEVLMQDPNFIGYPTNTWDNHQAHIIEHDNWRKRQEYENSDPLVKQLFEAHDRQHKRTLITLYGQVPPETGDPGIDAIVLNAMVFQIMNGVPPSPVGGSEAQSEEEPAQGGE